MANTYKLIGSSTATTSVANIEFTSIPNTYTDLLLVASLRITNNSDPTIYLRINSDSGSNYKWRMLGADGSSTFSIKQSDPASGNTYISGYYADSTSYTSSTFGNTSFYLPSYNSSDYKSCSVDTVMENNATANAMGFIGGLWENTSAITTLTLALGSSINYAEHSTAYLYGIKNS